MPHKMPPKKLCFAILRHYRNDRFISGQPDLLRWNLHDKKTYRKAQKTKIPGCRIISCERTEKSALPYAGPVSPDDCLFPPLSPSLLAALFVSQSAFGRRERERERERDGRGVKSPSLSLSCQRKLLPHSLTLYISSDEEKGREGHKGRKCNCD